MLEIVVLGNDIDAALGVAADVGGTALVADREDTRELAFRTVVRARVDDLGRLADAASVATLACFSRVICQRDRPVRRGEPSPGFTAVFGLVAHPNLTHQQADAHWRDVHAPLALTHHAAMWDYTQLSVVDHIDGLAVDGLALCAFRSMEDLRTKFFNDDTSRDIIVADVSSFADTKRSPQRLVATEHTF
ncbi:MAG: EthD domain-containing protein [Actinomycetota bacterium]|nr:EthD domain-containing protein [Actinomycetota bacterium]